MALIKLYEQPSFAGDSANGANDNGSLHETANGDSLNGGEPRKQWQSIDELDDAQEFATFLERNPRQAALYQQSGMNRRRFLQLSGAALALTGVTGCHFNRRPPGEQILPYVRQPEEVIPGLPLYFASTSIMGGYGNGVVIETHEGRPTQVAGNANHPASLGSADAFTISTILHLYDPERSTNVLENGRLSSWDNFQAGLGDMTGDGTGLRILTETVTSPTLASQISAMLEAMPNAQWHQYQPVGQDSEMAGAQLAFGEPVQTIYQFDQADVVLTLDANFLAGHPGSVRYARDFGTRRKARVNSDTEMSRLYAVESMPTITGATADHRLSLRASEVEAFTRALANALGVDSGSAGEATWNAEWFDAVVADLQEHQGTSLVVAGAEQTPAVHALAHAINAALGNVGTTVRYTAPVSASPMVQMDDLSTLVEDMQAGSVETLVIIGGNPAYNAPADLNFGEALAQVPNSVHLGLFVDETSVLCTWHLPQSHYIEAWGDVRAFDGTASLVQPPIGPLYETTRSAHELVALMAGDERSAYEILQAYWQSQLGEGDFEKAWRRALHDGVVAGTAAEAVSPSLQGNMAELPFADPVDGLELVIRPDPTIWSGEFAGNSWMQELPKPLTKLTWDNAALMSPEMAEREGLLNGAVVTLSVNGNSVDAPVWAMRGHPDNSVTITLGYGRTQSNGAGTDQGFSAYAVRTSDAPWVSGGLEMSPAGRTYVLAATQTMDEADTGEPIHHLTLAELNAGYEDSTYEEGPYSYEEGFYPDEYEYDGYAWGMSIDLTSCVGCNACVIACQSENNIPTVGKDEILNSREMHWIRLDRYYEGEGEEMRTSFQPVACVHCEQAPCEVVCPVQATVHSDEGLNQMVYNRCVGTRYCSANCPYGVRKFNFLDYIDDDPIWMEMRNPNVTVRARGVMEKCTYCVQRINRVKIQAGNQDRLVEDGEIEVACASACPTQAIVFGDVNDPSTQVAQVKQQPHDYSLLEELNTVPRTTYLSLVHNVNDSLANASGEAS